MKLGTVTQQPQERLSYSVNYADALTDGDNLKLDGVTALVSPAGLLVDEVTVIDPRVRFYASGGTSGVTYKVTLSVETDEGRRFQDELIFKVKEI